MTISDCFDLPITAADEAVAIGYNDYVREFLSYGSTLRNLFAIADNAPDCIMVNAHAAALHLAFEGAEGWTNAAPFLARMKSSHGETLSDREALFCSAVNAWAERDFLGALAHLDELTVRWPADLCAIKWGQYHAFNLGDQAALLRFAERARIVHKNGAYVHGMTAFALEQNHRLQEAEEEGLKATEIAIDDAWAHHAVAHVMETQGRASDGARWLDHCAHTWEKKGVFIRDHNWWHAALFRLSLGQTENALGIFDERLWGEWPEFPQEQIGAISMLWRLEMRGLDVGDRWTPVVEQARARTGEHLFPFHDIHYLYALARAGEEGEATRFHQSLKSHAQTQTGAMGKVWADVCAPTADAVMAFTHQDYDRAIEAFSGVLPDLYKIGGSHAQRHLFIEASDHAIAAKARQAHIAPR